MIGGGELPNTRLQRALANPAEPNALDRVLTAAHWAWFFVPHVTVAYILRRDDQQPEGELRFPRAARQMSATYDLGALAYWALPTAPPWWAAENGHLKEPVRRLMVDVGESVWGRAWPKLYDSFNGNPWAAFPSLHFGSSVMGALLLRETGPKAGAVGAAYSGVLGFALVYLGEHYVTDLLRRRRACRRGALRRSARGAVHGRGALGPQRTTRNSGLSAGEPLAPPPSLRI